MFNKDTETLRRYLMMALICLVLVAAAILIYLYGPSLLGDVLGFLGIVLFPFAIAWLAAIFTRPMVNWLCRVLRMNRTLAVILTMLICAGVVAVLLTALVLVVIDVVADLRLYFDDGNNAVMGIVHQLQDLYNRLNMDFDQLQNWLQRIGEFVGSYAGQGVGAAVDFVRATPTALLLVVVTIVAIFYWCRDEEVVKRVMSAPFSAERRRRIISTYDSISAVLGNYLRAQLLLVVVSIFICTAGLSILGLPNGIPLGLLAGCLDIIPMLGPGTMLVPWAAWMLLTGEFVTGIGLLIIFVAVIVVRNLIEPKILSDRMGTHPLAMLASLFIGMRLFGVVGLIIGPVAMSLGVVLFRERQKHKAEQKPPTAPPAPPNLPPAEGGKA